MVITFYSCSKECNFRVDFVKKFSLVNWKIKNQKESKQQSADERSRLVLVAISRIDATSVFDPSRRHNHLLCPNNLLPGIQTPRVPFWLDPKRPCFESLLSTYKSLLELQTVLYRGAYNLLLGLQTACCTLLPNPVLQLDFLIGP